VLIWMQGRWSGGWCGCGGKVRGGQGGVDLNTQVR